MADHYGISQERNKATAPTSVDSIQNTKFLEIVGKDANADEIIYEMDGATAIKMPCLKLNNRLEKEKNYFFNISIKQNKELSQSYDVYFAEREYNEIKKKQFVKRLFISAGTEWITIPFIGHTEFNTCDTIVLKKNFIEKITPIIVYQEISLIKNILKEDEEILKLGLLAENRESMFCINENEIHTNQNGIFELNNPKIKINFFSAAAPATPGSGKDLSTVTASESWTGADGKQRQMNNFVLDYMYKKLS